MNVLKGLSGKHGALLGAGFLLGTLGMKAVRSDAAHRLYVQAVAAGMRAKQGCEGVAEQVMAEVDDIVAEAKYLNEQQCECDGDIYEDACDCGCEDGPTDAEAAPAGATA